MFSRSSSLFPGVVFLPDSVTKRRVICLSAYKCVYVCTSSSWQLGFSSLLFLRRQKVTAIWKNLLKSPLLTCWLYTEPHPEAHPIGSYLFIYPRTNHTSHFNIPLNFCIFYALERTSHQPSYLHPVIFSFFYLFLSKQLLSP